jgi:hypothetical protein
MAEHRDPNVRTGTTIVYDKAQNRVHPLLSDVISPLLHRVKRQRVKKLCDSVGRRFYCRGPVNTDKKWVHRRILNMHAGLANR